MVTTHTHKGITWIDLESPTDGEISEIIHTYKLHPLVGESIRSSPTPAQVRFYPDYILVVLTLPVRIRRDGHYEIIEREVDFVIGRNFLITSRTDTIEQLEYFSRIFDAHAILEKDEAIGHPGHLFYYIVKRIYAGMRQDLENLHDSLVAAESKIFEGDEREMVEELSGLSRELIDFKQTARVHLDIWKEMVAQVDTDQFLFGKEFSVYIHGMRDEFDRLHELISNDRELVTDLRSTNDSLLNAKQNEIVKILTLVAFIFYPLTFISSIFSIPAIRVPIVDSPQGWNVIMLGMLVLTAIMWGYFKRKRWI